MSQRRTNEDEGCENSAKEGLLLRLLWEALGGGKNQAAADITSPLQQQHLRRAAVIGSECVFPSLCRVLILLGAANGLLAVGAQVGQLRSFAGLLLQLSGSKKVERRLVRELLQGRLKVLLLSETPHSLLSDGASKFSRLCCEARQRCLHNCSRASMAGRER